MFTYANILFPPGGGFSLDIFFILFLSMRTHYLNVQIAGFGLFSEYLKGPHPHPAVVGYLQRMCTSANPPP